MKCIACGQENVENARFCAFCGVKLPEESSPVQPAPEPEESVPKFTGRQNARPLSDNPYQRPRPAVVHPVQSAKPAEPEPEPEPEEAPVPAAEPSEPVKEPISPRNIIKPAAKRVFLFDEEIEEQEAQEAQRRSQLVRPVNIPSKLPEDEFEEFEDEEDYIDDDDDEYEDDEPTAGRIFVRIFSVLTVLALVLGVISFLYSTTIGSRLRASWGLTANAGDYLLLADWQLEQNSYAAAAESYYTAFCLDQENLEISLRVGAGFENSGDDKRAEQLYSYMIDRWPQANEPYDRLMAMLSRQGRTEQYEALLAYRTDHQTGYTPPALPAPATPSASHESGAYTGSIQLSLSAGNAEIRYTLDGTAPTPNSRLYTGPITLTAGTHHIRAIAVEDNLTGGEWSGSFIIS